MTALQTSPINKLMPDVLLEIFDQLALDSEKSNAPLISSILCCQKWRPLASSVLYRHVVLDDDRLEFFVNNHMSCEVTSLTVTMDAIGVDPSDPSLPICMANVRVASLRKLCSFIGDIRLVTVSISVDMPFPCTAMPEVASIVNSLPESCTGLEIDLRHSSSFDPTLAPTPTLSMPQAHPHLCDSIRAVLPRLKHIRLRLPVLCPAIFSSLQDLRRQAIHTPLLKTCLINLSLREPGPSNQGAWATECGDDHARTPRIGQQEQLPSALPSIKALLRDFADRNSNILERIWIMDVEPMKPMDWDDLREHAAWIRRDFMSDKSYPIPVWDIGFFRDSYVARVPSPTNPEETEDWVSTIELVESVAEGGTWTESEIGARLPTRDLQRYKPPQSILSRSEYKRRMHRTCSIWRIEEATGQKILPRGPGELMQQWDVHEITPLGWTRDWFAASPMARES